uniref:Putative secreted protein n=1 Tax=Panstrongylus lignarius TaxID=156445 RepID=A0A224Y5W6_9HEMI
MYRPFLKYFKTGLFVILYCTINFSFSLQSQAANTVVLGSKLFEAFAKSFISSLHVEQPVSKNITSVDACFLSIC